MMKLYRSQRDKKLFGLCGGIAEALNVDSTLLRLVTVVTAVFSAGTVILLYVLACLVVPKEPVSDMGFGHNAAYPGSGYNGHYPPSGRPASNQYAAPAEEPGLDEMMKDIEKKAMWKEIEELRAKLAKYEKGDV
ncbi:PspC domain-containing protein [Xylanibacillus composti]|uniref:Phage shock protein PspC N-terminal domain-containing protein n=1 Tax=Xylanibacillus composti TaxID=1572762 RepID=A0A8J4H036_9BACL|nr:PspC domain-containing protein [Xylanibacillus composti]MDT9723578.1 PspC domain-containing protein [Xylanibacillus composti]GIQ68384.1 hypothetical protein XYCOK13_12080 [Xylanibacillus composti]